MPAMPNPMFESSLGMTMKDLEGRTYRTFRTSIQEWSQENLATRYFSNGDEIPLYESDQDYLNAGMRGEPACCYYNNDATLGPVYGLLYNGYAAHDPRGLAPEGWRIPDEMDWMMLEAQVKTSSEEPFVGLHGGSRGINGAFGGFGTSGYWWSLIDPRPEQVWGRRLSKGSAHLAPIDSFKRFGFSVRCMRELLP